MLVDKHKKAWDILTDTGEVSADGLLAYELGGMVDAGNIGGAEDRLFDALHDEASDTHYDIAMEFYDQLEALSDRQLAACDFSREEIAEGIEAVRRLYGEAYVRLRESEAE